MNLVKIVDSIAAVPTTRLNLSDGTIWRVTSFDAPPPRLRRSMSQNAMTDGGFVSSSQYEMRTLTIGLFLTRSTEDANATQLQTLSRELDRETNYLMYQPVGAAKPVFFRTMRSDMTSVREIPTPSGSAQRMIEVEILAEPFALGLKETISPGTIANDPAGANPHYVDVTGVIGDVAAPSVITTGTGTTGAGYLAVRQRGTPSNITTFMAQQAESATSLGTDTTNPGGGPDAAMSGTGTNNYVRTSFATTASAAIRIEHNFTPPTVDHAGSYRLLVVLRRSDASSTIRIQANVAQATVGPQQSSGYVTVPLASTRQVVDLGIFNLGPSAVAEGVYGSSLVASTINLDLWAERTSGAGTLDWDYWIWLPADESLLTFHDYSTTATGALVFDAANENLARRTGTTTTVQYDYFQVAGGFPALVPNQTNRVVILLADLYQTAHTIAKTDTAALTVTYWPRYLYVRPATT